MSTISKYAFAPLATLALATAACSGQVASSDTSQQSQAQSTSAATTADGGAHRPPHPHGPPPEAFTACEGKAVSDVCSVTLKDETLAGTCVSPPAGAPDTRIVCRPDKMPAHGPHGGPPHGPPPGPPPAEVFAACDGKAADAACSVTLGDHTISGTCKSLPPPMKEKTNDTRLACAPAHPPPPPPAPPQK